MQKNKVQKLKDEAGVAILLVIFIVALSSILVVNLTYSTFLNSRTVGMIERQLQAEYILKSLLNFSQTILSSDIDRIVDSNQDDIWGIFNISPQIPGSYLGLSDSSVGIFLEIIPKNSKININFARCGAGNTATKNVTAEALERLFQDNLSFDDDLAEEETNGRFAGRTFSSTEVVANIIDWQDTNDESCNDSFFDGIEGSLDEADIPNQEFTFLGQLDNVPGMTANRMKAAASYLTVTPPGGGKINTINLNIASPEVLAAIGLSDSDISDVQNQLQAENLSYRSVPSGFNDNARGVRVGVNSENFEVYAKVSYGIGRPYYLKADLSKGTPRRISNVFSAEYY